jgi:AbrB family looped-hinge helix DNA binding protein
MRINDKGRVTIPPELRERYGLSPGTPVELVAMPGGVLIRSADPRELTAGTWPAKATAKPTAEDFPLVTRWDRV